MKWNRIVNRGNEMAIDNSMEWSYTSSNQNRDCVPDVLGVLGDGSF